MKKRFTDEQIIDLLKQGPFATRSNSCAKTTALVRCTSTFDYARSVIWMYPKPSD